MAVLKSFFMCKKWSLISVIPEFFADQCSQTIFLRQLLVTDRYLQRCMNKVNITYRALLFENGLNINEICENYKEQLKILTQRNILCGKFVKRICANQPEKKLYRRTTKI